MLFFFFLFHVFQFMRKKNLKSLVNIFQRGEIYDFFSPAKYELCSR